MLSTPLMASDEICQAGLSSAKTSAESIRLRLIQLGYAPTMISRLIKNDAVLASRIATDPLGQPMRLNPVWHEKRFKIFRPLRNNLLYRGLTADPWRFDPTLDPKPMNDPDQFHHIWTGRLAMAQGYAQLKRSAEG